VVGTNPARAHAIRLPPARRNRILGAFDVLGAMFSASRNGARSYSGVILNSLRNHIQTLAWFLAPGEA
jgi:hypothetical protein